MSAAAAASAASGSDHDDDSDDEEMIQLQAALARVNAEAAAEEQTRGRAPVRRVATGGPKEQWAAARRAPDDALAPVIAVIGGIDLLE
jgi:hypothetical protein